jgi:hypothetical protein
MRTRTLAALAAVGGLLAVAIAAQPAPEKAHKLTSVSTRKLADSLHAVIVADRDMYLEQVAEVAGTNSLSLPSHAQMLRLAAQGIQQRGAEFSYTLRSLWPVHPKNGPQTQVEQEGLERVRKDPAQPVYVEEELGGRSYFTAIYAERATRASCVDCHNRNPHSPRRDYRPDDVLGALVVRVPLEF